MCTIELRFTISANDEHALVAQLAEQAAQQPQRAPICPVQVVSIEEQRSLAGDIRKHLPHCVEEKQALFMSAERLTFGKRAEPGFEFGSEFCDLNRIVAEDITQLVVAFLFAYPTAKSFD